MRKTPMRPHAALDGGRHWLLGLMLACASCAVAGAPPARDAGQLVQLINDYRAAPGSCHGHKAAPAGPLAPQPPLSAVRVRSATFLEQVLEDAGYPVVRAQAVTVTGPADAAAALAALQEAYCDVLLGTDFSAIGALHVGNEWQVVLAQPLVRASLPDWPVTGQAILQLVNQARAVGRNCGARHFEAAPPVAWNAALASAALTHSQDMAMRRYFSHHGSDGTTVAERAQQAGYAWRRVGENIAAGQPTPEAAVAGWLDSPGHCANLMDPGFTEMGAAHFINPSSKTARAYWTQVFATPR